MQTNLPGGVTALVACLVLLASTGCSGGSGGSGGGGTAYTLGGTLAGLGAGQTVSLQVNGGDTLTLSSNGAFSFPTGLDAGSAYAVTVQSHTPGIACSVSSGSGTVGSSDVTGIDVSCAAGTESVLYSFGAIANDGQSPVAGLIMDNTGNLYGTTFWDGAYSGGTVFRIRPSGTETTLYAFGAKVSFADGSTPEAGLIMDSAGNLYGTTAFGGAIGWGTVFRVGVAGSETVLHSFGAIPTDGETPQAGLIMDSDGNLYGTTWEGGANNEGTVFRIDASGTETILHTFGATAADGQYPSGGLIMDDAGNLYGTTSEGGANNGGTVFRIDTSGTETILYSFWASATDGRYPIGGVIMDSAGNLYGTTSAGGANGAIEDAGTVFEIDASGTERILHSFGTSSTDGKEPEAGLVMDNAGNLYGTTTYGGANDLVNGGDGTVFKISVSGTETILCSFGATSTDGIFSRASLLIDSAGNLYGTNVYGGASGGGTVFVIN